MSDLGYSPAIQSNIALRRGWMAGRSVLVGAIVTGAALAGLTRMFDAGLLAASYWRLAVPASTWRLASFYIVPKIRTRSVGCSRAPHATRTRAI